MSPPFIDPEAVEARLDACLDDLNADPDRYTDWEQAFLEELEDWLEEHVCTDKQWEKLAQIAAQHGLG